MAINLPGAYFASNISATTGTFTLQAGNYAISYIASTWGSGVQLQLLAGDGLTWININTTAWTANGFATQFLPSGTYRLALTGVAGGYISIQKLDVF